jgi:predicted transcriptional regulator
MKNFKQKNIEKDPKNLKLDSPLVTEFMTRDLITFRADTPIHEVIDVLLAKRITGAPVLNERNEVVGLIDDKDCLNVLFGGAYYNHPVEKNVVESYMSNVMRSITVHDNILDVANIFIHSPYKRLLVMDDNGKLVGQISRRDILRAIKEMQKNTW